MGRLWFARWHLHPLVSEGNSGLPESVPAAVAAAIKAKGFSYDDSDRFKNGTYAPAPNYSYDAAEKKVAELEVMMAGSPPSSSSSSSSSSSAFPVPPPLSRTPHQSSSSSSSSSSSLSSFPSSASSSSVSPPSSSTFTPHGGGAKRRRSVRERVASQQSPDDLAAQNAALRARNEELEERLRLKDKQLEAMQAEAERKMKEECERIYREAQEEYGGGLSRANLLSDDWHAANPEAAKHLFGFRTWYETRAFVWALFDVKRPQVAAGKKRKRSDDISDFEKILIN